MKRAVLSGFLILIAVLACSRAQAQNLAAPTTPAGGTEIINLDGQTANISTYDPVYGDQYYGTCLNAACNYSTYTSSQFTVPANAMGETTLTFAFRNDSGFFGFSDVVLCQVGASSSCGTNNESLLATAYNLAVDPSFASGNVVVSNSQFTDLNFAGCSVGGGWCGFNQAAGAAGLLAPAQYVPSTGSLDDGSYVPGTQGLVWSPNDDSSWFWQDGAIQQYDGIYQNVTLTPGDTYSVSFNLEDITANNSYYDDPDFNITNSCGAGNSEPSSDYTNYQTTSTNGDTIDECGNGVNVVGYVGYPGLPTPQSAPEPGSLWLIGSGIIGLGLLRRRWHGRVAPV